MPNEFTLEMDAESSTPTDPPTELTDLMEALGPKRVETKGFKAEQFDPLTVQKLVERRRSGYPTLLNCVSVVVESTQEDCDPCRRKSCNCSDV